MRHPDWFSSLPGGCYVVEVDRTEESAAAYPRSYTDKVFICASEDEAKEWAIRTYNIPNGDIRQWENDTASVVIIRQVTADGDKPWIDRGSK